MADIGTTPTLPAAPTPLPHGKAVWRGFWISSAISAGIAILGAAMLTVGIGVLIIMPYGLIQLAWILPLYFTYRGRGQMGEAKGVLLSCAANVVLSVACWGVALANFSVK